jgi:hypothetical protein
LPLTVVMSHWFGALSIALNFASAGLPGSSSRTTTPGGMRGGAGPRGAFCFWAKSTLL